MQGAEDDPVIHSQLHRIFCASAGTQMMIVRISRDWPTYIQRTYQCPWCPHRTSEVVRSPMVNPPTVAMDRVAQS
jgi:hypothetical protein